MHSCSVTVQTRMRIPFDFLASDALLTFAFVCGGGGGGDLVAFPLVNSLPHGGGPDAVLPSLPFPLRADQIIPTPHFRFSDRAFRFVAFVVPALLPPVQCYTVQGCSSLRRSSLPQLELWPEPGGSPCESFRAVLIPLSLCPTCSA